MFVLGACSSAVGYATVRDEVLFAEAVVLAVVPLAAVLPEPARVDADVFVAALFLGALDALPLAFVRPRPVGAELGAIPSTLARTTDDPPY